MSRLRLSKKSHCQLHGEPFQAVTLRCVNPKCPVKPGVAAGDVFNGGEAKARGEAANIWNTRATPAMNAQPAPPNLGDVATMAIVREEMRKHRNHANQTGSNKQALDIVMMKIADRYKQEILPLLPAATPAGEPSGDALREALRKMIYETTHLSPMEEDGSHRCRITRETLEEARAAYHGAALSQTALPESVA